MKKYERDIIRFTFPCFISSSRSIHPPTAMDADLRISVSVDAETVLEMDAYEETGEKGLLLRFLLFSSSSPFVRLLPLGRGRAWAPCVFALLPSLTRSFRKLEPISIIIIARDEDDDRRKQDCVLSRGEKPRGCAVRPRPRSHAFSPPPSPFLQNE